MMIFMYVFELAHTHVSRPPPPIIIIHCRRLPRHHLLLLLHHHHHPSCWRCAVLMWAIKFNANWCLFSGSQEYKKIDYTLTWLHSIWVHSYLIYSLSIWIHSQNKWSDGHQTSVRASITEILYKEICMFVQYNWKRTFSFNKATSTTSLRFSKTLCTKMNVNSTWIKANWGKQWEVLMSRGNELASAKDSNEREIEKDCLHFPRKINEFNALVIP